MSRSPTDLRHRAREAALQILYQCEIAGAPAARASETFFSLQWHGPLEPTDDLRRFATALVEETIDRLPEIDPLIAETAERWRPERMAVIDRLVLRMAVCELLRRDGTPPAVIINEALELARTFSTEEAVKFINGMLDGVRRKLDA
jgi:N utilization substance protein B